MDRCLLMKIAITVGGAGLAGLAGFKIKQMKGLAIGAGAGGVIGWLLAPGCAGSPPLFSMIPSGPRPVSMLPGTVAPSASRVSMPSCPFGTQWNSALQKCQPYAR